MGSMVEINDTLQITKEQGFPDELDIERHLHEPYSIEAVSDKIFSFRAKPAIRVYQQPPVRNFLVENKGGKWIYWGQCFVLEVVSDYEKKETAGKFRIIRLNTPEEMRQMFELVDRFPENNYFGSA